MGWTRRQWLVLGYACSCSAATLAATRLLSASGARTATTAGASRPASPATGRGTASYAELRLRALRQAGMLTTMADDKQKPEISEEFFAEWLRYGFAEMHIYLVKHAEFAKYLDRRQPPTEEPPDGSTRTP